MNEHKEAFPLYENWELGDPHRRLEEFVREKTRSYAARGSG